MKIKDIDQFIDETLIPKSIIYKRINNNYNYENQYEEIIPLSAITKINVSAEEKQYIIKKLKDKKLIKSIGKGRNTEYILM